jgi:hypothetical protein
LPPASRNPKYVLASARDGWLGKRGVPENNDQSCDSELARLILRLRFHGIAVDSARVRQLAGSTVGAAEMPHRAKVLGLKARAVGSD